MFCPKCGSLLLPKTVGKKKIVSCKCGYKSDETKEFGVIKEKINNKRMILEVINENEGQALPLVDEKCPKCKHPKSFFWTMQTRAGDEPETRFFRCEKCKHTWRDYS